MAACRIAQAIAVFDKIAAGKHRCTMLIGQRGGENVERRADQSSRSQSKQ
jgi:hypothetical protein